MADKIVVIRDMSAGNAETGEAWQETKIFDENVTLKRVMDWATIGDKGMTHKRITITRPDNNNA